MFRILDLGAHDGYIANWIGRRMRSLGHEVHIDGIELNPTAADAFVVRNERDGIAGFCKVGLAEDAPKHFMAKHYDAVVAFELIEHVPDIPKFLSVCERMVNNDGRIYLSTPDGTFGAGCNPHHLRAMRSVDLYEILRRRGPVHDMVSGPDGVAVASYSPRKTLSKGEVAIYCGAGWEEWSPTDIETKGLGGSETAATRLSHELSQLGYIVTVYGEVKEGAHQQVAYRRHELFDPTVPREAVIVSRAPALFDQPINAKRKVLWVHDTDYGDQVTPERVSKMDAIFTLSLWHYFHFTTCYPYAEPITGTTANGIEPEYFTDELDAVRVGHRAIYSSSPDRGLDLLLELWPRVRERIPDAELVYCYSSVYDRVAEQSPPIAAFRERIRGLAEQPGVRNLGSLNQRELARQMRQAGVWLAPSYSTPSGAQFNETYCIGAVEAAAAGCHRVMSNWGALKERQENTMTTHINASKDGAPIHAESWIDAICEAMQADWLRGSGSALDATWGVVAADFDRAIRGR